MHHHIHAQPWYRQAAQTILDNAHIPDLYSTTHHGQTSAGLMYSGTDARLIVMVGTRIGGRLIDTQPAPRLADDLTRWTQAREQISDLFTQAGFPDPRPTELGLVLEVPERLGAPARVQLDRTGLGRYTARIDGHPDLVAEIDGQVGVATSRGFTLHNGREQHYATYPTEHDAACAFAFDCGFGPRITVTT